MNVSNKNSEIAKKRWKKKHSNEKEKISHDILLKASICGFLAGDGSVQKRKEKNFYHHQIDFFPDDLIMLNTYMNAINKVYNKKPTVREHKNFLSARFCSKVVVEDLFSITSFGIKDWLPPMKLLKSLEAKKNWLRAFYSAEGYVNQKSIKIQTVNRIGMLQVAKLLHKFGIKTNYYEYEPKKKNHSKVSILFIHRKEDRRIFYEKIGFWHGKKTRILKESLGL